MGVTIKSNHFSCDMGYAGFSRFRGKVASLSNEVFGKHYEKLEKAMLLFGGERTAFYEQYNAETEELIKQNFISIEIANFCYQADCSGEIDQDQAKLIYEKLKDCDEEISYGYTGKPNCTMFSDLKEMFKDCAENGGKINWC